jgi:hypothetical protein
MLQIGNVTPGGHNIQLTYSLSQLVLLSHFSVNPLCFIIPSSIHNLVFQAYMSPL